MSAIRFAVLTVSDTASKDAAADKSGPSINDILNEAGFQRTAHQIVPDDVQRIRAVVTEWLSQEDIDLIITTGGTGFGVRDCTPEAIKPLLEREAPGLVHLMVSKSLKQTPLAALARPIAGTIGKTLVVTLPGSVKAVRENLDALITGGVLNHAIDLIQGGTGKKVHDDLAKANVSSVHDPGGHHHHHHHHRHHHHDDEHEHIIPQPRSTLSHDPSAPVSSRHRVSPYPVISLQEALDLISQIVQRLGTETLPVSHKLSGYVLAEDVRAPQNAPPTSTTSVDGYALRSTDAPGIYKVLTSHTHALSNPLPPGHVFRINTGGPLPAGADTIIMVEDTRLVSTVGAGEGDLEGEEKEVETLAQIPAGENVRLPGSDARVGDLVLEKGQRIGSSSGEIGTLAFVGRKEVTVYRKPVVALLSTGNELNDLHSSVQEGLGDWSAYDTNRPSLQAALEGMGYDVIDLGIVADEIDVHVDSVKRGLGEADILLTTGGTSMGPTDLLKPVIERHFNGTIHFGRVAIKPGKPTTFATIPVGDDDQRVFKPMFALPGNPASALVTFHVFVVPALRILGGWPKKLLQLPRVMVEIQSSMALDPRIEFHRVVIKSTTEGLKAFSTGGQRSSRVASLNGANGFVILPPKIAGQKMVLEAGSKAEAIVIGELQMA